MVGAWVLLLGGDRGRGGLDGLRCRARTASATRCGPRWCSAATPLSIWLLAVVIRHIPVSVTYAVWSGLGTAGIAAGRRAAARRAAGTWSRALALLMIIGGVLVLNLHGAH